jgi:hypothetical protein
VALWPFTASIQRDLQVDINLLTSSFPTALADALDRTLAHSRTSSRCPTRTPRSSPPKPASRKTGNTAPIDIVLQQYRAPATSLTWWENVAAIMRSKSGKGVASAPRHAVKTWKSGASAPRQAIKKIGALAPEGQQRQFCKGPRARPLSPASRNRPRGQATSGIFSGEGASVYSFALAYELISQFRQISSKAGAVHCMMTPSNRRANPSATVSLA